MPKIGVTDTILRDAHQSLAATRMTTEEMLPACERLNKVGYYSLEVWGGATYDACLRFLNEDPWDRLHILREALPDTKLQMLLRGQNLLGYKHYADDVVETFCHKAVQNGIDIIRIFDALNDVRNMKTAIDATRKANGIVECAMSYTVSEVHTLEYFVELAIKLEKMGADLICVKDMANLLLPYEAFRLVTMLKQALRVPIHMHTHNTTGTGDMVYLKSIEAGADIVDTALAALGNGTAQPATEALVATLEGSEYDTGLDLKLLSDISSYFKTVADRLTKDGFLDPQVLKVDINTLIYQVPGGMLSNLISQLKQQGAESRLREVLEEVPRVRADLGYPPLVTPTSQIVGTQAVLNVLQGERYKMCPKETRGVVRGEYGALPVEISSEIRKQIIGDDPVITHRPADDIQPEMETYRKEIAGYMESDEDVLTYAMFPQVAEKYFQYREAKKLKVDSNMLAEGQTVYPV